MQAADDWPGVFIRGDDAFAYSLGLRQALALILTSDAGDINTLIARNTLAGLADMLEKSNMISPSYVRAEVQQIERKP